MKRVLFLIMMIIPSIVIEEMSGATLDEVLVREGYVDVKAVDPEIIVELMYAREDNFIGKVMYTTLTRAFLHPAAAKALKKAQDELKSINPGLTLKVCDAARPMSVQRIMYEAVRGTSKARYVSNPANGGGLHNYGLAVDITIVDSEGKELDMGTHVDFLGSKSNIDKEEDLVRSGKITLQARNNRILLRKVMNAGGWKPLKSEWWHFNLCSRTQARAKYKRLDF